MILSRTMREDDYPELVREGRILQYTWYVTGMWWPKQERNSLWEYALAHKTLSQVFKNRKKLRIADYGYRTGHLAPMLIWLGHDVTLMEVLGRKPPEEENYMMEHLLRVTTTRNQSAGSVTIWPKPLGAQVDEDARFDAVFALSTFQGLDVPYDAFVDVLSLVKKGGLLFFTMNEEGKEKKVFDRKMYESLIETALQQGFKFLDGLADYDWDHQENTFVSLAMLKETE
jgi:SAM-dependent methyltransferase